MNAVRRHAPLLLTVVVVAAALAVALMVARRHPLDAVAALLTAAAKAAHYVRCRAVRDAVAEWVPELVEGRVYHAGHAHPVATMAAAAAGYTIQLTTAAAPSLETALTHLLATLAKDTHMDLTTLIDTEVQSLLPKIPNVSTADQADLAAIEPHVRAIVIRDFGVKAIAFLAKEFPTAAPTINALTPTLLGTMPPPNAAA